VESGEVDLGIVGSQSKDPYLDCHPLVRDNLVILGKDCFFRDKGKRAISAQEITAIPWIVREQGSGTRMALEKGLQDFGLCLEHLPIAAIVDSTVLKCIQAGLGVSLTSRWAADEILTSEEGITAKNPGWSFERSFYILRHQQRSISRASSCFFRQVQQDLGSTPKGQQMMVGGACHE
jgi:DNA-binding transcriptional LysR family regulator